ncbi:MAG: NAD(P)-dependent oxidoreductase, partial [Alphaproteobacteria bacterium]|nr:NAD(P)-dependent oxidoreductase [Alphaproteobacteria bacterium]
MTFTVAFIGYGEVGQLFGKQLAAQQGVAVRAHDVLFDDAAKGSALKAIADKAGVAVWASEDEACGGASLVISAVTADRAVDAARQCANALTPDQIYVDLNSISPTTKGQVADALQRDAAGFVEFAVMAPVAGPGIAVPILAGGAKAKIVAEKLNPLGLANHPRPGKH